MTPLSTTLFRYDPRERLFVAEASRLRFPPGLCLQSVALKSAKTGAVLDFAIQGEDLSADYEVVAWNYHNARHNLSVRIFND